MRTAEKGDDKVFTRLKYVCDLTWNQDFDETVYTDILPFGR